MLWIIQTDLAIVNRMDDIVTSLSRLGIPYRTVELTVNDDDLNDIDGNQPIMTNGSIYLSKQAVKRGWEPRLFNDNFDYSVWFDHFKDELLNRDAVFTTIREANPQMEEVFVRPLSDEKGFTGHVKTIFEFRRWKENVVNGNLKTNPDMPILFSKPKKIGMEHRHYIVDGEVVSSSRYKLNGQVNHSPSVDQYVVDYAQQMADIWRPSRGFVLDTYIFGDEIGIVEMGCITHAGLYCADVQKIVMALDSLELLN